MRYSAGLPGPAHLYAGRPPPPPGFKIRRSGRGFSWRPQSPTPAPSSFNIKPNPSTPLCTASSMSILRRRPNRAALRRLAPNSRPRLALSENDRTQSNTGLSAPCRPCRAGCPPRPIRRPEERIPPVRRVFHPAHPGDRDSGLLATGDESAIPVSPVRRERPFVFRRVVGRR
jgi:hypothetical protein